MRKIWKSVATGLGVAAMVAASSLTVVPTASAGNKGHGSYHGKYHGNYHSNYHGNYNHGYYHHSYSNNYWVGPAIGFGTGLLFGSILAPHYYYAPRYGYGYGSRDAYCHARYRSYNSYTHTYTGYDGRHHYC